MSSIRVTRGGDVFRLPCNDTETLLALLRRAGCTLPAACGGHGRCGKCRVSVNGVPRLACRVVPEDGDEICWRYTCDLGADIGGAAADQRGA